MSSRYLGGNMEFEFRTAPAPAREQYRDESPFCIAILGDFSGRGNRGLCRSGAAPAGRGRMQVDVDNFDKLPGKLGAEIHIPVGGDEGPRIEIRLGDLDDFHPDRLFDRLEIFQRLKDIRQRLQDTAAFAGAAAEVRSWTSDGPDPDVIQAPPAAEKKPQPQESDGDTIERLLGKQPVAKQPPGRGRQLVDVDSLIREAVKGYVVAGPDPQQGQLVGQVDEAISGQMRAILHHPDFQQLEAAWRMLQFIVSRVETDQTLRLYIIDISKAELAADLVGAESLPSAGMYRLLVDQSVGIPGADPWALLVGAYTFGPTEADIALLRQLAKISQAAGAPFLAAADSAFAGCESIAATPDPNNWDRLGESTVVQEWQKLRGLPEAAYIGLTLPRFLLRLPWGQDTEPVDRFSFEELPDAGDHERHLWGNSAFIGVCLLAEAFRETGWNLTDSLQSEITDLPMHVFEFGGKRQVIPGAETYLTDRAAEVLINKGLMPVLSLKGRNAVRMVRFQSIAEPPAPLAGRWR